MAGVESLIVEENKPNSRTIDREKVSEITDISINRFRKINCLLFPNFHLDMPIVTESFRFNCRSSPFC